MQKLKHALEYLKNAQCFNSSPHLASEPMRPRYNEYYLCSFECCGRQRRLIHMCGVRSANFGLMMPTSS